MPDLKSIPDDVKWRLATRVSALLPALYESAYRGVVGENYDEIEQEIWMKLSRMALTIAGDLSLPASTASELAGSMRTVLTLMFGPGYKSEILEVSQEGAVVLIRHCPFLETGHNLGVGGPSTFRRCMALILTTVPQLNKNYSARFVRTMCTGDRQCEIKIYEAKNTVKGEAKKK
ncbi:MAG: hypothetical protein LUQ54_05695 [Methanoregula sp.]|nr:hypothetical protein [Methanoregula sp.]